MSNKIWWEKTVEYKFVCDYCGKLFLMPLDGKQEKAGDVILISSKKFMLIEFKKKYEDIKSEEKKFKNLKNDIPSEIESSNFHKLIYGEINDREKLTLKEVNYWNGVLKKTKGRNINENIFNEGIESLDKFKNYVKEFTKLKKKTNKKGESGGNGFNELYSVVLGIDSNGNINQIISFQEFLQYLDKDLNLDNELDFEPSL